MILYGILISLSLLLPVYKLKGPIEGEISLLHYNLFLYGSPISIDALNRASALSIAILIVAILSLLMGLHTVISSVKRYPSQLMQRITFSLSLSFPSASAFSYLSKLILVGEALRELPTNLGSVTSAGILIIPPVQVESGFASLLLTPFISIFFPVLVMALVAVSVYLNVYSFLEKSEKIKKPSMIEVHS